MTDLDLRRRVAEAVGWTDVMACHEVRQDVWWLEGVPPDDRVPDMDDDNDEIPAYETDIAAAWELVEEVSQCGQYDLIELSHEPTCSPDIAWSFAFTKPKCHEFDICKLAPTAPTAICLAYLAWCAAKEGE